MPLPLPQTSDLQLVTFFLASAELAIRGIVDQAIDSAKEFWAAFPLHPLDMADAVIGFFTSIPGIVLTSPIDSAAQEFKNAAARHGVLNKLVTMEKAIDFAFLGPKEFVQIVTLSNKSTALQSVLGWFAKWLYRTIKNIKFIRALIRSRTEAEFIEVIINSYLKKFRLIRAVGFVLGVLALAVYASMVVITFGLAMSSPVWLRYPLPQDSKRVRVRIGRVQKRVNRRKGPDL